ncbi:hypothetical protein [Calidithermus chliarophilus]|uniref:hypothetical protein n=1 Tax=Calidithermus chliarophilus TaxID=52023 RepID=UPI001C54C4FF|nr:hypothetical protein [Calidithermus chliarophilus]
MQNKAKAAHCLPYSEVRLVIPLLEGLSRAELLAMYKAIYDHRGTPQEPADWSEPEVWIPQWLRGKQQALAMRVWEGSGRQINPRYVNGHLHFIDLHQLLETNAKGVYRLAARGKAFMREAPRCCGRLTTPRACSSSSSWSPRRSRPGGATC